MLFESLKLNLTLLIKLKAHFIVDLYKVPIFFWYFNLLLGRVRELGVFCVDSFVEVYNAIHQ